MAKITGSAPDLFCITTFVMPLNVQFLMRDEEPSPFHTDPLALFTEVKTVVASLINRQTLCWIGFSYLESDECTTVPERPQLAPQSDVVCSVLGKMVSIDGYLALCPARGMDGGEVLETGRYRF